MKVTVLGCGSSSGVPMIGNEWGVCDPDNPKNRRRRPSILVEKGDVAILVDTSPDLRQQSLDAGIERLDAVLYTHEHADHINGIDEIRVIRRLTGNNIAAYGAPDVLAALTRRFGYLFSGHAAEGNLYRPVLDPIPFTGPFRVGDIDVVPFEQDHGICISHGFRFGNFAYSTDVVELSDQAFATLEGVTTWIVDCLRNGKPHPTHANLEKTLQWIDRLGPERAVLTHMNHQADYEELCRVLPDGVEPAYDGMVLEIEN